MMTLDEFKKELKKYGVTANEDLNEMISFYYNDFFLVSIPYELCLAKHYCLMQALTHFVKVYEPQESLLELQTPIAQHFKPVPLTTKDLGWTIPGSAFNASNFGGKLTSRRPGFAVLASTPPASCSHTFKPYIGLSETFEFCTKCDERKGRI